MQQRATLLVAALLLLTPSAFAGADLVRSGGILGKSVSFQVFADPGELFVLVPSFQTGPTPVALIAPLDPRVLDVGIDLVDFVQAGAVSAAGFAQLTFPLPANSALSGLTLFAQFLTIPGPVTLIDEISNRVSFVLAASGTERLTLGLLSDEIATNALTLLDDGRVLISGGGTPDGTNGLDSLNNFELFDPQTQTFTTSPAKAPKARALHTATKLSDGRVLLVGGLDDDAPTKTADIYDPATDTVVAAADLSAVRFLHTATLLQDGRVLVVGGASSFDNDDPLGSLANLQGTTELYDPATNVWTPGASLPKGRLAHAATRLPDGSVLITGGIEVQTLFGLPIAGISLDCRRYIPASNQVVPAPPLASARALHAQVALNDGDVLVAGGTEGNLLTLNFGPVAACERFDAATGAFIAAAPLGFPRSFFTLVNTGTKVVAIGGIGAINLLLLTGVPTSQIEVADQSVASWTNVTSTLRLRVLSGAVAFDGGERVLFVGGDQFSFPAKDRTAEIFHP